MNQVLSILFLALKLNITSMCKNNKLLALFILLFSFSDVYSQLIPSKDDSAAVSKPWYENFQIRGYLQVRYNRLLETNPDLECEQCDKSWGDDGGFFIRRARIIFSGQISKRVYFYIQPDFASSAGTTGNVAQFRDAYFDLGLD